MDVRWMDNGLEWFFRQGFTALAVFLMNLGALSIALWQVKSARDQASAAKTSALAAQESAQQAWTTLSSQMLQTSLAMLSDEIRQVSDAVGREEWTLAGLRIQDFCEDLRRIEASMSGSQKRGLKAVEPAIQNVRSQLTEKGTDPAYVLLESFTQDVHDISDYVNRELGNVTVKP